MSLLGPLLVGQVTSCSWLGQRPEVPCEYIWPWPWSRSCQQTVPLSTNAVSLSHGNGSEAVGTGGHPLWVCLALSFKEGAGLSVVVYSTCNPSTQKKEIEGPLGLGDLLNLHTKTPPTP